jgi:hypothetical protein
LIAAAPAVDQDKVVIRQAALPLGRRMAQAVHAGPCIPRAPAQVALRVPAAVRRSALPAQGSARVRALVPLALAVVRVVLLRLPEKLRARREQLRNSAVGASNIPRPRKAQ